MRTRIALVLALCAAAAPLHAQKAGAPYHGPGYEVVLPARYEFMKSLDLVRNGQPMTLSLFGSDAGMLMVIRANLPPVLNDTSLATRRAMLQLVRSGMLQAQDNEMRMTGEPVEILKDDRITLRTPIEVEDSGESFHGVADVSVSRQGTPSVWLLMAIPRRQGGREAGAGRDALDSFRLTGEQGFMELTRDPASAAAGSDLSAKP